MNWERLSSNIQSNLFIPFETLLRSQIKASHKVKPTWIVGVPRSGTTLIYQILCKGSNIYYISNRLALKYRIALLTRIIERNFIKVPLTPTSFDSKYGVTNTLSDPSEAGDFFYQFFPVKNPYSDENTLNEEQKRRVRELISAISFPQEKFVSKNTIHSLRIKALKDLFPESSFVWVSRDTISTAYSIIKARDKFNISNNEWWGIKPPGWEEQNQKSLVEKVIWQISATEKIIEEDLLASDSTFIKIDYSDICNHPGRCVKSLSTVLNMEDEFKDIDGKIPNSFGLSKAPDDMLSKEIEKALKKSRG